MLSLQNISYRHPDKELLFGGIHLAVNNHHKIALIGNNGSGKSTLLKIIAREIRPSEGQCIVDTPPYYVPQLFGQYNHLTVAQALRIEDKVSALKDILANNVTENKLNVLGEDWTIEERSREALNSWGLSNVALSQKLGALSGGQKTRVFLAGIAVHDPQFILLDEPTNHLDTTGRQHLFNFILATRKALVLISHDRKLLNLPDTIWELNQGEITVYGGNYEFYARQKQIKNKALIQEINTREKALRKAKDKEQKMLEHQQKSAARGKEKHQKAGVARIMINTLRNQSENSTSKMQSVHAEKIGGLSRELHALRAALAGLDKMRFGFENSSLHRGKILFKAANINYAYNNAFIWKNKLNLQIRSGERIVLTGLNGSGKTTLLKLISGDLDPKTGTVYRADNKSIYVDQDYSLIDNRLRVYEQAQKFNDCALHEHEIRIRLNRFLFTKVDGDKSCEALSGGEKMRLMLCCLTISHQAPDILILDEPTNNLDIQNLEMLTAAANEYQGTLIVVSHDEYFLGQINIERKLKI